MVSAGPARPGPARDAVAGGGWVPARPGSTGGLG